MGVDVFVKCVRPVGSLYEEVEGAPYYFSRAHFAKDAFLSVMHRDLLPKGFTLDWLERADACSEEPFTFSNAHRPEKLIESVDIVQTTLELNNDQLPERFWFQLKENRKGEGIVGFAGGYILFEGEVWQLESGWDKCLIFPKEEGENSSRAINVVESGLPLGIHCYKISVIGRHYVRSDYEEALRKFNSGARLNTLTVYRQNYHESYSGALTGIKDVCEFADANQYWIGVCYHA